MINLNWIKIISEIWLVPGSKLVEIVTSESLTMLEQSKPYNSFGRVLHLEEQVFDKKLTINIFWDRKQKGRWAIDWRSKWQKWIPHESDNEFAKLLAYQTGWSGAENEDRWSKIKNELF